MALNELETSQALLWYCTSQLPQVVFLVLISYLEMSIVVSVMCLEDLARLCVKI